MIEKNLVEVDYWQEKNKCDVDTSKEFDAWRERNGFYGLSDLDVSVMISGEYDADLDDGARVKPEN